MASELQGWYAELRFNLFREVSLEDRIAVQPYIGIEGQLKRASGNCRRQCSPQDIRLFEVTGVGVQIDKELSDYPVVLKGRLTVNAAIMKRRKVNSSAQN